MRREDALLFAVWDQWKGSTKVSQDLLRIWFWSKSRTHMTRNCPPCPSISAASFAEPGSGYNGHERMPGPSRTLTDLRTVNCSVSLLPIPPFFAMWNLSCLADLQQLSLKNGSCAHEPRPFLALGESSHSDTDQRRVPDG